MKGLVFVAFIFLLACGTSADEAVNPEVKKEICTPDTSTYKIISTDHHPQVKGYNLLIKFKDQSKENITKFVNCFMSHYNTGKCIITMYKSEKYSKIMTKYPLSKSEYKNLAKYAVAQYNWDTKEVWIDPYKDAFK